MRTWRSRSAGCVRRRCVCGSAPVALIARSAAVGHRRRRSIRRRRHPSRRCPQRDRPRAGHLVWDAGPATRVGMDARPHRRGAVSCAWTLARAERGSTFRRPRSGGVELRTGASETTAARSPAAGVTDVQGRRRRGEPDLHRPGRGGRPYPTEGRYREHPGRRGSLPAIRQRLPVSGSALAPNRVDLEINGGVGSVRVKSED